MACWCGVVWRSGGVPRARAAVTRFQRTRTSLQRRATPIGASAIREDDFAARQREREATGTLSAAFTLRLCDVGRVSLMRPNIRNIGLIAAFVDVASGRRGEYID